MFPCISSSNELEPITFVQPINYQLPRVLARGGNSEERREKREKTAYSQRGVSIRVDTSLWTINSSPERKREREREKECVVHT